MPDEKECDRTREISESFAAVLDERYDCISRAFVPPAYFARRVTVRGKACVAKLILYYEDDGEGGAFNKRRRRRNDGVRERRLGLVRAVCGVGRRGGAKSSQASARHPPARRCTQRPAPEKHIVSQAARRRGHRLREVDAVTTWRREAAVGLPEPHRGALRAKLDARRRFLRAARARRARTRGCSKTRARKRGREPRYQSGKNKSRIVKKNAAGLF